MYYVFNTVIKLNVSYSYIFRLIVYAVNIPISLGYQEMQGNYPEAFLS